MIIPTSLSLAYSGVCWEHHTQTLSQNIHKNLFSGVIAFSEKCKDYLYSPKNNIIGEFSLTLLIKSMTESIQSWYDQLKSKVVEMTPNEADSEIFSESMDRYLQSGRERFENLTGMGSNYKVISASFGDILKIFSHSLVGVEKKCFASTKEYEQIWGLGVTAKLMGIDEIQIVASSSRLLKENLNFVDAEVDKKENLNQSKEDAEDLKGGLSGSEEKKGAILRRGGEGASAEEGSREDPVQSYKYKLERKLAEQSENPGSRKVKSDISKSREPKTEQTRPSISVKNDVITFPKMKHITPDAKVSKPAPEISLNTPQLKVVSQSMSKLSDLQFLASKSISNLYAIESKCRTIATAALGLSIIMIIFLAVSEYNYLTHRRNLGYKICMTLFFTLFGLGLLICLVFLVIVHSDVSRVQGNLRVNKCLDSDVLALVETDMLISGQRVGVVVAFVLMVLSFGLGLCCSCGLWRPRLGYSQGKANASRFR